MKNSTKGTNLKEVLALFIALPTGLFVLGLSTWLYFSSRAEVEDIVNEDAATKLLTLDRLLKLKESALSQVVEGISRDPKFQSAFLTMDGLTIDDFLKDLSQRQGLDYLGILEGKKVRFSHERDENRSGGVKEHTHGRFIAVSRLKSNFRLLIAVSPQLEDIGEWQKILNAKLFFRNREGLAINKQSIEIPEHIAYDGSLQVDASGEYYFFGDEFYKGTLKAVILLSRDYYWKRFEQKKNSLLFIAIVMIFSSIFLSMILAHFLEKNLRRHGSSRTEDWDYLFTELEELRGKSVS